MDKGGDAVAGGGGAGGGICQICEVDGAKYTCPRCAVPYCSLKCYKDVEKHLNCSESFYKNCIQEEIRSQQLEQTGEKDPRKSKEVAQALKRFRDACENEPDFQSDDPEYSEMDGEIVLDSDDDEPLEERLKGINLDDPEGIWMNLTPEERADFKKFVLNFKTAPPFIPEWTPWWTVEPEYKLVEEIPPPEEEDDKNKAKGSGLKTDNHRQPPILQNIPTMKSLTRIQPNDRVKRSLANIIAAYVWTCRLYNGEFITYENPEEVAYALISLSSFLESDTIFTTFDIAVTDVVMNACKYPEVFDGGPTLQASLNRDVFRILSGPELPKSRPTSGFHFQTISTQKKSYCLSALTDCYTLLSNVIASRRSKEKAGSKVATNSQSTYTKVPPEVPSFIEEVLEPDVGVKPVGSSAPLNLDLSINPDPIQDEDKVSFEDEFLKKKQPVLVDVKLVTKAKRKVHYMLAFANEFDIL